jgi:hypothetical protein
LYPYILYHLQFSLRRRQRSHVCSMNWKQKKRRKKYGSLKLRRIGQGNLPRRGRGIPRRE